VYRVFVYILLSIARLLFIYLITLRSFARRDRFISVPSNSHIARYTSWNPFAFHSLVPVPYLSFHIV